MSPDLQSNHLILAQLKNVLLLREHSKEYVERILKKNFNVNSRVSSTAYLEIKEPDSIGCTALHLAYTMNNIEAFKILLNSGADYEIKNKSDSTILHNIVENSWKRNSMLRGPSPYAKLILSVHIESNNFSNPCSTHGISHFHAACLTANVEAVEFFLKNGVSIDQSVSKQSPSFPGYTGLHFAVKSYSLQTVHLLLNHGANSSLKNAAGMTPLFMLLEQKIILLNFEEVIAKIPPYSVAVVLQEYEKILYLLLKDENAYSGNSYPCHLISTLKDSSVITRLVDEVGMDVNRTVDKDSPFSGFTELHFAAYCNLDTVIVLLNKGAAIEAMSTQGLTPFDICLEKYNIKEIHKILLAIKSWKDITLSDNKTKLVDLIFSMQNAMQLDEFLKASAIDRRLSIPMHSPLWPGCTILHLVVLLCPSDLGLIGFAFAHSNVAAQDIHGRTALNLAYRRGNSHFIYHQIMNYGFKGTVSNPMDEDNLSHLHILCAVGCVRLVEKLLLSNIGISLAYSGLSLYPTMRNGFTPLHVAVASGYGTIVDMLMRKGADPFAADFDGLTPIHWILSRSNPSSDIRLSTINPYIIERIINGLSHLHVASFVGDKLSVERLLKQGSNVNAAIEYVAGRSPPFLERYVGYTPLYLALQMNHTKVMFVLVKAGADIFAKNPYDFSTPFFDVLDGKYEDQLVHFLGVYRKNKKIIRVLEKTIGLTLLHVACRERDLSAVVQQLALRAKVNAKIHKDSPIWPGCTPLHVLMMKCAIPEWQNTSTVREIIDLLLNYGLDVGIANTEGNTVVHLAHDSLKNVLLNNTRSFKFNPVNYQGLSHFDIACLMSNIVAVKKLIMKGADVNRQVDFFSDRRAGCSALHLLMSCEKVEKRRLMVDLILDKGARVDVEDSAGRTVLHLAAGFGFVDVDVMKRIIDAGVDINAIDIYGKTALETLLSMPNFSAEKLKLFINYKCNINAFNPINENGYLPMILDNSNRSNLMMTVFEAVFKYLHNDELDRTVVHNIVCTSVSRLSSDEYAKIIKDLAKLAACGIDVGDKKGRTALHLAAKFVNGRAVAALLKNGADFNMEDFDGKAAFSRSMECVLRLTPGSPDEQLYKNVLKEFVEHARLLEFLNIYVSPSNKSCTDDLFKLIHESDLENNESYIRELQFAKTIQIRMVSWTLYDFLSETGLVVAYPYMTLSEQQVINQFVVSYHYKLFPKLEGVIKLQYQKALRRRQLIEPAVDSLIELTGISFSRFCCENILRFLANSELKKLIMTRN